MATGAGKTAIFSTVLNGIYKNNKTAIMVVRGRSLVDQASKRLDAMEVPHGVLMAGHKKHDLSQRIQVVSINTATSRSCFPPAEYLVIDEAHFAVSESFIEFLNNYKESFWLSVTATPWAKDGLEHLASDVVYPISIVELTQKGYLAPAKYFCPSDFDPTQLESVGGEFKDSSSIMEMDRQNICGNIVDNYLKNCQAGRTFLFAVNVSHANKISDLFYEAGVSSVVITADTPIEKRLELIYSTNLIISVATLTTGIDIPDLKNIILARPTQSKNLYIQMLGRGTRPFKDKTHFTVYDHVGNARRHGFIEYEDKADLKPLKRSKNKVGDAPVKICHSCMAIMPASIKTCKECGEDFPVKEKADKITGKGELKEVKPLTQEERDKAKFILTCSKLLAKAWAKGHKPGWMWYEVLKRYEECTFKKYRNEYYRFVALYNAWDKAGKNDTGDPKGYKNNVGDSVYKASYDSGWF